MGEGKAVRGGACKAKARGRVIASAENTFRLKPYPEIPKSRFRVCSHKGLREAILSRSFASLRLCVRQKESHAKAQRRKGEPVQRHSPFGSILKRALREHDL